MLNIIFTIARKELKEALRDRRTLSGFLAIVLGFPVLYSFSIGFVETKVRSNLEKDVVLGYESCDQTPELCNFLSWQDITIVSEFELEKDLESGDITLGLYLKEPSTESPMEVKELTIKGDSSDDSSASQYRRLQAAIANYQNIQNQRKLALIGINPTGFNEFNVRSESISNANSLSTLFGKLVLGCLIMASFFSILQYANDSIAGERERGSLEPLFLLAAPRWAILAGKWLFLQNASILGAFLSMLMFKLVTEVPTLQSIIGFSHYFSWSQIAFVMALFFPVLLIAPLCLMLISSYAKTVKEAQVYSSTAAVSLLLPTMFIEALEDSTMATQSPIFGQALAAFDFFKGKELDWSPLMVSQLLTLLVVAALGVTLYWISKQEDMISKS